MFSKPSLLREGWFAVDLTQDSQIVYKIKNRDNTDKPLLLYDHQLAPIRLQQLIQNVFSRGCKCRIILGAQAHQDIIYSGGRPFLRATIISAIS